MESSVHWAFCPYCNCYYINGGTTSDHIVSAWVQVTQADIAADQIVVALSSNNAGNAILTVTVSGSSVSHTVFNDTKTDGTYTFQFDRPNLPIGQYTTVTASWAVTSPATTGSKGVVTFYVLGSYKQSQYNTPYESQCALGSGAAYVTQGPSACVWSNINLLSAFITQAWVNGSGVSLGYGPLQIEWICAPPAGSNKNYFREVNSIVPGCGAPYSLSDSTVAWSYQLNGDLQCGDLVLIVGLGAGGATVKRVTDKCAPNPPNPYGCVAAQLDNYNSGAACSARAFPNLGNLQTIRLYR